MMQVKKMPIGFEADINMSTAIRPVNFKLGTALSSSCGTQKNPIDLQAAIMNCKVTEVKCH